MYSNWENLINRSYKNLLNKERTYAAFDKEQIKPYIVKFRSIGAKEIFDPMSGYGTLTPLCNAEGIDAFCVEINPPSYLWQVLVAPQNKLHSNFAPKKAT